MIIGVDPGKTGGITVLYNNNCDVDPMPETMKDIHDFFLTLKTICTIEGDKDPVCYIEKVNCDPRWGAKQNWQFSANFHCLKMALISNKIRLIQVTAKEWQKKVGLVYPEKITSIKKKKMGKALAQELFPDKIVDVETADSMLIAYYGSLCEREQ